MLRDAGSEAKGETVWQERGKRNMLNSVVQSTWKIEDTEERRPSVKQFLRTEGIRYRARTEEAALDDRHIFHWNRRNVKRWMWI